MCNVFVLTIDIALDHDDINKRQIVDMLHKGLNRYVIEDVTFFKDYRMILTISCDRSLRMTTVKKDIEQIFSVEGKETWLDDHTELRLKNVRCTREFEKNQ